MHQVRRSVPGRELPNHEAGAYIIIELESTTRVHLEQDMEAVADLLVENGAMDVLVGIIRRPRKGSGNRAGFWRKLSE